MKTSNVVLVGGSVLAIAYFLLSRNNKKKSITTSNEVSNLDLPSEMDLPNLTPTNGIPIEEAIQGSINLTPTPVIVVKKPELATEISLVNSGIVPIDKSNLIEQQQKLAEEARLAGEAKLAEIVRLAKIEELAKIEKVLAFQLSEQERLAELERSVSLELENQAKLEQMRLEEQARLSEEARLAEIARLAELERLVELKKASVTKYSDVLPIDYMPPSSNLIAQLSELPSIASKYYDVLANSNVVQSIVPNNDTSTLLLLQEQARLDEEVRNVQLALQLSKDKAVFNPLPYSEPLVYGGGSSDSGADISNKFFIRDSSSFDVFSF